LDGASEAGPTWQIADDRFLLRIPGVARFLIAGGQEIVFETEDGTPPEETAIFLVGTAFGILMHQRSHVALHASAVAVNGKAALFCGPSGAGKSTIAAALMQRGYPLVSDDLCGLELSGTPMVHRDGRQLKLWVQAIERLDLAANRRAAVRHRLQKYFVDPDDTASAEALPIGVVYVLHEAPLPHAPAITRPSAIDAARLLRDCAYRPRLVSQMGQQADYFNAAVSIANITGIFQLTRRFEFAALSEVIARLEGHWREIGLAARAA
jgi:hypothetical protein